MFGLKATKINQMQGIKQKEVKVYPHKSPNSPYIIGIYFNTSFPFFLFFISLTWLILDPLYPEILSTVNVIS